MRVLVDASLQFGTMNTRSSAHEHRWRPRRGGTFAAIAAGRRRRLYSQ